MFAQKDSKCAPVLMEQQYSDSFVVRRHTEDLHQTLVATRPAKRNEGNHEATETLKGGSCVRRNVARIHHKAHNSVSERTVNSVGALERRVPS